MTNMRLKAAASHEPLSAAPGRSGHRSRCLAIWTALVLSCLLLHACRGDRAARYGKLRKRYPDCYRVGLFPAVYRPDPLPGISGRPVTEGRRQGPDGSTRGGDTLPSIDDFLYQSMVSWPELRLCDADTVEAFARQCLPGVDIRAAGSGKSAAAPGRPPGPRQGEARSRRAPTRSDLERLGEMIRVDAFIAPSVSPPGTRGSGVARLEVFDAYTGGRLFAFTAGIERRRGDSGRHAQERAFRKILRELRRRLAAMARSNRIGGLRTDRFTDFRSKRNGTVDIPGSPGRAPGTGEVGVSPYVSRGGTGETPTEDRPAAGSPGDDGGLGPGRDGLLFRRLPEPATAFRSDRNRSRPSPSYDAGIEQLHFELDGFGLSGAVPPHHPVKSARLSYSTGASGRDETSKARPSAAPAGPVFELTVLDLASPVEAKRFLDDAFEGVLPQRLAGARCFATRNRADGSLSVGVLLGKFAALFRGGMNEEREVTRLASTFVKANRDVYEFFAAHPRPPGVTSSRVKIVRVDRPVPVPGPVRTEVKWKLRTVEIEKPVVPAIEIRLDTGALLALSRDRDAGTRGRIVYRAVLPRQAAGPQAVSQGRIRSPGPAAAGAADGARGQLVSLTGPGSTGDGSATLVPGSVQGTAVSHAGSPGDDESRAPADAPGGNPGIPSGARTPDGTGAVLETVATSDPEARLHYDLGCRYLAANRLDTAAREFLSALDRDPRFEAPRRKLESMNEDFGLSIEIPRRPPDETGNEKTEAGGTSSSAAPTEPGTSTVEDAGPAPASPGVVDRASRQTGHRASSGADASTTAASAGGDGARNGAGHSHIHEKSDLGDSILLVGMVLAVCIILAKLLFFDER